eukprot:6115609-Prymnesium_polylepis.1
MPSNPGSSLPGSCSRMRRSPSPIMSCTRRSTIQHMLSSSSPSMCRCVGIHSLPTRRGGGVGG